MTRNSPEILPYCQHCGSYKGVGPCKNPDCDGISCVDIGSLKLLSRICVVCSKQGEYSCSRCGGYYCSKHSMGMDENNLISIEQRLGTCIICRKIVCEQCWILNNRGLVICLVHLEKKNSD